MPRFASSLLFLRLAKPGSFSLFFLFFFLTDYNFYTTDQPPPISIDFLYLSQTAVVKMRPGGILLVIKKVGGEPTILQATLLLLHPVTSDSFCRNALFLTSAKHYLVYYDTDQCIKPPQGRSISLFCIHPVVNMQAFSVFRKISCKLLSKLMASPGSALLIMSDGKRDTLFWLAQFLLGKFTQSITHLVTCQVFHIKYMIIYFRLL